MGDVWCGGAGELGCMYVKPKMKERKKQVAARAAAASKARGEAVAAAAKADALERAIADEVDCGEGASSGAAGPGSEASEAVVPDQFMCSITAEIMTDPVNTVCRTALAIGNPMA